MTRLDSTAPIHQANIPDSRGLNLYTVDPALDRLLAIYLVRSELEHWRPVLERLGARAGGELDELALSADHNPPTLLHRNRRGDDSQRVCKHPDYVALEQVAFSELGLAAISHTENAPSPLIKYALTYLFVQAEFGLCCSVSMTDSLTRTLRKFGDPQLVARYLPALTARELNELFQGAMFMTEREAGSDISAISTTARYEQGQWKLSGEKWFCSNPDADLAMVLARPEDAPEGMKGISLFLLPRVQADGSPNAYRIVRLKDKLGTRSMASGEITLQGATAFLIGEIGRGFQQMADMVNMSRLSNGVRSAGLMRRALTESAFIARSRYAFGRRLIDMPLIQRQLIKMSLPTEQARSMFLQTATLLAKADAGNINAQKCVRILTPLIKFRACRDARRVAGDAMELRGGLGYIEEWSDARILRDAHLGSIWEGTSNIVALDVVRASVRDEALMPLREHLSGLLEECSSRLPKEGVALASELLDRTMAAVDGVARADMSADIRHAATALYNLASAVFMMWEAVQCQDYRRLGLAYLVLIHKLLPTDPLASSDAARRQTVIARIAAEVEITEDEANSLLPC